MSRIFDIQDYLGSLGLNGKITFNSIDSDGKHTAREHTHANLSILPAFVGIVTKPTKSATTAGIQALQDAYDALDYSRKRAAAYPSIGDQLDMQYHDLIDGTETWKDAVEVVKDLYPKPTI